MIKSLRSFFAPKLPAEKDMPPEVAVAALLVEAASADGLYVNIESDMIAEILLESFAFDASRADAVLAEAEGLAEMAVGSHQFTRHAKKLALEDRVRVIEAMYRVILSDGERSPEEDSYVRHVAGLLHVDDVSRAQARQRAEVRVERFFKPD